MGKDLGRLGFPVEFGRNGAQLVFSGQIYPLSGTAWQSVLRSIQEQTRRSQMPESGRKAERTHGKLFPPADGLETGAIRPDRIDPRVIICRSSSEKALFTACRFRQSVPSTERVGRRLKALVYDLGQSRRYILGAIELSSSLYSLRCRDEFFGWRQLTSAEKRIRLSSVMDVSVAMALEPYSHLLGGKLAAMLALGTSVTAEFYRRYGAHLESVVAICSSGLHCPIFNRIMVQPGGLYRRIGETAGYTTAHLSDETLVAAKAVLGACEVTDAFLRPSERPIRIFRRALRISGLDPEPFLRISPPKGVYVGQVSPEGRNDSRASSLQRARCELSDHDATAFWRTHLLSKRPVVRVRS